MHASLSPTAAAGTGDHAASPRRTFSTDGVRSGSETGATLKALGELDGVTIQGVNGGIVPP